MPRRKLSAIVLVLVLALSVAGAQYVTVRTAASTTETDVSGQDGATTIASCTVIDDPGHYELAANLSGEPTRQCIDIRASDVVLDGNGHTIDATETHGIRVNSTTSPHNVTIRDVRIRGKLASSVGTVGVLVENASDISVSNVTIVDAFNGVSITNSSDVVVRNSTMSGQESFHGSSAWGILSTQSSDVRIVDNVVRTFEYNVLVSGENITVGNNTLYQSILQAGARDEAAVVVSADNSTIRGNEIRPGDSPSGTGVVLRGNVTGTVISENTIAFPGSTGIEVAVTASGGSANVLANNTIESTHVGVDVVHNTVPLRLESNVLRETSTGVRVLDNTRCYAGPAGAETVAVHRNSFVVTQFGVQNNDDEVLNATQNYWGAADGPSSPDDATDPLEDPETGTLADGDGGAVSEHPDETGVSNVHFDAWLAEPPADAGATENASTMS